MNYWQIEGANPPVIVNVFEIDINVLFMLMIVNVNFDVIQLFAG